MTEIASTPRTFAEHLDYSMWITKGARFNADRRLRLENEWSQRSIALLSVYVVVLSLATVIPAFEIAPATQTRISLYAAALSLLLVVLSLLENGRNYLVRAERLHICAMKIDALLSEVRAELPLAIDPSPSDRMLELSRSYHAILAACAENHSDVDFDLFRGTHAAQFDISSFGAWTLKIWCWIRSYWFKSSAGIAPLAFAAYYIFATK